MVYTPLLVLSSCQQPGHHHLSILYSVHTMFELHILLLISVLIHLCVGQGMASLYFFSSLLSANIPFCFITNPSPSLINTLIIHSKGCHAVVSVHAKPGSWVENGVRRFVYTMDLKNDGACSFTGATLNLVTPTGTHIQTSWGYSVATHVINCGTLNAGQTYQGGGLVVSGMNPFQPINIQSTLAHIS